MRVVQRPMALTLASGNTYRFRKGDRLGIAPPVRPLSKPISSPLSKPLSYPLRLGIAPPVRALAIVSSSLQAFMNLLFTHYQASIKPLSPPVMPLPSCCPNRATLTASKKDSPSSPPPPGGLPPLPPLHQRDRGHGQNGRECRRWGRCRKARIPSRARGRPRATDAGGRRRRQLWRRELLSPAGPPHERERARGGELRGDEGAQHSERGGCWREERARERERES